MIHKNVYFYRSKKYAEARYKYVDNNSAPMVRIDDCVAKIVEPTKEGKYLGQCEFGLSDIGSFDQPECPSQIDFSARGNSNNFYFRANLSCYLINHCRKNYYSNKMHNATISNLFQAIKFANFINIFLSSDQCIKNTLKHSLTAFSGLFSFIKEINNFGKMQFINAKKMVSNIIRFTFTSVTKPRVINEVAKMAKEYSSFKINKSCLFAANSVHMLISRVYFIKWLKSTHSYLSLLIRLSGQEWINYCIHVKKQKQEAAFVGTCKFSANCLYVKMASTAVALSSSYHNLLDKAKHFYKFEYIQRDKENNIITHNSVFSKIMNKIFSNLFQQFNSRFCLLILDLGKAVYSYYKQLVLTSITDKFNIPGSCSLTQSKPILDAEAMHCLHFAIITSGWFLPILATTGHSFQKNYAFKPMFPSKKHVKPYSFFSAKLCIGNLTPNQASTFCTIRSIGICFDFTDCLKMVQTYLEVSQNLVKFVSKKRSLNYLLKVSKLEHNDLLLLGLLRKRFYGPELRFTSFSFDCLILLLIYLMIQTLHFRLDPFKWKIPGGAAFTPDCAVLTLMLAVAEAVKWFQVELWLELKLIDPNKKCSGVLLTQIEFTPTRRGNILTGTIEFKSVFSYSNSVAKKSFLSDVVISKDHTKIPAMLRIYLEELCELSGINCVKIVDFLPVKRRQSSPVS
ncbi:hypothetical protein EGR_04805 [Echinococcus granulosus]|uniref:Uncharacterized protein n=1 Tax=Echinococcus granulosus TaxID=6210 RepID=W6UH89_ECHGR|nr:hypothetical protein EGR_04805 [Echinococcus granulosus]EUB60423.1 hypothetical protein EGR_04805 [Echinococcus granulosus]